MFTLHTLLNAIICCSQLNTCGVLGLIRHKWIISHRCSWMAVYVFCCNAQSKSHSDLLDISRLSLFYQLPNCNLFTQHVLFILWRDTTSELWTPVHSFTLIIQPTANTVPFHSLQFTTVFHTIRLILCFQQAGEIDNLTVSLGQSTLVVLCRFHVGAGIPGVAPHYISPPSTFNVLLDSYWFDKPWFLTEGKLAAVRIIPSSWGSQRGV